MYKCKIVYSGLSGNCNWFNKTNNLKLFKKIKLSLSSVSQEPGGNWTLLPEQINHLTNPFAYQNNSVSGPVNLHYQSDFSYQNILGLELDMIILRNNGSNVTMFESFIGETWYVNPIDINLDNFVIDPVTNYHKGTVGSPSNLWNQNFTETSFSDGIMFKITLDNTANVGLIKFDLNVYYN